MQHRHAAAFLGRIRHVWERWDAIKHNGNYKTPHGDAGDGFRAALWVGGSSGKQFPSSGNKQVTSGGANRLTN